ncbi:hypothetical protein ACGFIX_14145 [Nocardia salmonicida]|uniref:hypothetical protein n=1 Tax=Nocardia salmonicida TaxID=53431 RepID=UPI0037238706
METMSQTWTVIFDRKRVLLTIAVIATIIGVLALVTPVSVTVDGDRVGCGTSLVRDNVPAEQHGIVRSMDGWARILELPNRSDSTGPGAYTACTDALSARRWFGWPVVVVAVGAWIMLLRAGPRQNHP